MKRKTKPLPTAISKAIVGFPSENQLKKIGIFSNKNRGNTLKEQYPTFSHLKDVLASIFLGGVFKLFERVYVSLSIFRGGKTTLKYSINPPPFRHVKRLPRIRKYECICHGIAVLNKQA